MYWYIALTDIAIVVGTDPGNVGDVDYCQG